MLQPASMAAADRRHGLHLPNAKRTPASANEQQHKASFSQKIGGGNKLAIVVGKFERGRLCPNSRDAERVGGKSLSLELGDGAAVDSLNVSRNVLGDELFALGKNFAQRPRVGGGAGFLERAPLHGSQSLVASRWSFGKLVAMRLHLP